MTSTQKTRLAAVTTGVVLATPVITAVALSALAAVSTIALPGVAMFGTGFLAVLLGDEVEKRLWTDKSPAQRITALLIGAATITVLPAVLALVATAICVIFPIAVTLLSFITAALTIKVAINTIKASANDKDSKTFKGHLTAILKKSTEHCITRVKRFLENVDFI